MGNAPARDLPDGLRYEPELIDRNEEERLIAQFGALDFAPFQFHGFTGKRRVVYYGWRYDFEGGGCSELATFRHFSCRPGKLRRVSPASKRLNCSRPSLPNMRPVRPSAGIVTARCSATCWAYRCCRPASFACAGKRWANGSGGPSQLPHDPLTFSAGRRAGNGSTAFQPFRHCDIR